MNKYQEALEAICFGCDDYVIGGCEPKCCKLYVPIKELIDKQEKYRWHDLRKDPNDLPKENGGYWVCYYWYSEFQSRTVKSYDETLFRNGKFISGGRVVAWKCIEEFENE